MFIRNIKEELYRGFHNRGMYMALVLGIFFIICHFLFVIMKYASSYIGVYINIDYPSNVFTTTLMFDMEGVFPIYYAYIFPLFAALPFAARMATGIRYCCGEEWEIIYARSILRFL